ncbi:MAG: 30S ribosomal protein S4 [Candidatus Woesearchaeota archaeon]
MGDIRKTRKKYQKPNHPWNKQRIDAEKILSRDYGLKNKKELWKAETILKGFKDQIKSFPSMNEQHREQQKALLRARLHKLGLITQQTELGEVLGFSAEKILERRLQTIVYKKGLARTSKQARQFILHEHILVNGRKVNAPSYLVLREEEATVEFVSKSSLAQEEHPERAIKQKAPKTKPKKEVSKEEEIELVQLDEESSDEQ